MMGSRVRVTQAAPLLPVGKSHPAHAKNYQRSYSSTEIIMRVHIRPRWDKVLVSEAKPQMVAKWLAEKAEEGLKPATVEKTCYSNPCRNC